MRRPVKCRTAIIGPLLVVATLVAAARTGRTDLLFGGLGSAKGRPAAALEPHIPKGASRALAARPEDAEEAAACSSRYPLCVHRGKKVDELRTVEWLSALESAYERVVLCLRAPGPLDDLARGGSPGLDLYLERGARALSVETDVPILGGATDSAAAFCVAGDQEGAVERAATLCIGEAVGMRLDASETPFSRRALATELWLHSGSPTSADTQSIDDVQAAPDRAIVARELSALSEGGAILLDYVGIAHGRGAGVDAPLVTYALSAGPPSPPGPRWVNEPDTLDVLRATFGPTPSDVARFFGDFTLARAFMGTRDSALTWPLLRWTGDYGRVRFEWSVPFSSLPRRLSPARPVEPTGSTYLWVNFDGAVTNRSVAFQADWEPPVSFRWVLAVVSADGRLVRRIDVPYLERETHVERIVSDLEGGAGLLIAGTNLGGIGPTYPFDPDFEPFEPHAYTVYLAEQ